MIGIYKITNPEGKVYIGQSIDLDRRIRNYEIGSNPWTKLRDSHDKFGIENHVIKIIEECDSIELTAREYHYQLQYDSIEDGLNENYAVFEKRKYKTIYPKEIKTKLILVPVELLEEINKITEPFKKKK